ncbi:MAG TPA: POTRA domain-containing protein, partial [Pyrinomonadaceae bacterium]|nr:POTRA domain-containing protein [Pyrinomonadaceae bacterium]
MSSKLLCFFTFNFLLFTFQIFAQNKFENRKISDVSITFEGVDKDVSAAEQFRLIAKSTLGDKYSAVKIRETLDALYQSKKIVTAQVEATAIGEENVNLRFIIKRKTQAERVTFKIAPPIGEAITEDELLLKLNLINSGAMITERTLQNNADSIQVYLRERGFYKADVSYSPQPLPSAPKVPVTFQITPNAQS